MIEITLPEKLNLDAFVEKVKNTILDLLKLYDVTTNNNSEDLQYEIYIQNISTPFVIIEYEKDDDSSEVIYTNLIINNKLIEEDKIRPFMYEIGYSPSDYKIIKETGSVILKRGMINAFQKATLHSKGSKNRVCAKCGFTYPVYRGNRKKCPVCGKKSGTSMIRPYIGDELSTNRSVEDTGAPPPSLPEV